MVRDGVGCAVVLIRQSVLVIVSGVAGLLTPTTRVFVLVGTRLDYCPLYSNNILNNAIQNLATRSIGLSPFELGWPLGTMLVLNVHIDRSRTRWSARNVWCILPVTLFVWQFRGVTTGRGWLPPRVLLLLVRTRLFVQFWIAYCSDNCLLDFGDGAAPGRIVRCSLSTPLRRAVFHRDVGSIRNLFAHIYSLLQTVSLSGTHRARSGVSFLKANSVVRFGPLSPDGVLFGGPSRSGLLPWIFGDVVFSRARRWWPPWKLSVPGRLIAPSPEFVRMDRDRCGVVGAGISAVRHRRLTHVLVSGPILIRYRGSGFTI